MDKNQMKVAIAMSGGVDSSVAAVLLQEEGYNIFGVTMHHFDDERAEGSHSNCLTSPAIEDAKSVCERLKIPHYAIDVRDDFERLIVDQFENEYFDGRTPNPCTRCNPLIKWTALFQRAKQFGATHFATGHYARIVWNDDNRRFLLKKGIDSAKDQSYVLWGLSQHHLSETLLPLGEYTKNQVRDIATKYALETSHKQDSQEICFIHDDDYARFLKSRHPQKIESIKDGEIVDISGTHIGTHRGYPFYTIGQRKKLGIAVGRPVYVVHIDPRKNRIIIGDKQDLQTQELYAGDVNWIAFEKLNSPLKAVTRIRYNDRGRMAEIFPAKQDSIRVVFEEPAEAVTPGQSVVFYEDDILIGGAVIQ